MIMGYSVSYACFEEGKFKIVMMCVVVVSSNHSWDKSVDKQGIGMSRRGS